MDDFMQLVDLAQLPIHGFLIVALFVTWKRLEKLTDRFLSYLEERAKLGDVAAQRVQDRHATPPREE